MDILNGYSGWKLQDNARLLTTVDKYGGHTTAADTFANLSATISGVSCTTKPLHHSDCERGIHNYPPISLNVTYILDDYSCALGKALRHLQLWVRDMFLGRRCAAFQTYPLSQHRPCPESASRSCVSTSGARTTGLKLEPCSFFPHDPHDSSQNRPYLGTRQSLV